MGRIRFVVYRKCSKLQKNYIIKIKVLKYYTEQLIEAENEATDENNWNIIIEQVKNLKNCLEPWLPEMRIKYSNLIYSH